MNYNLTMGETNNIDLSKISIDKKQAFDLKYIDDITMECDDEVMLKQYLFEKNLITEEDLQKDICISYGVKNKRYIPVLYSDNKETVNNIKELANEIKKYFKIQKEKCYEDFTYSLIMDNYSNITNYFKSFQTLAGNHKFLRALQEYASSNPQQNLNIKDISIYIEQFKGDKKSRVIYIALFETFRRLFYKFNTETKDLEFNYKGFRDFCVFYCEYKRNIELSKQQIEEEKKPSIDELLEDDSYKEPKFAPNSEEEAKFLRYLEELEQVGLNEPIEEHPHYNR